MKYIMNACYHGFKMIRFILEDISDIFEFSLYFLEFIEPKIFKK